MFDTDYLTALQRGNVDLVTSAVTEIREQSVMTKDGIEHPADVIVLANGFAVTEVGFPMKVSRGLKVGGEDETCCVQHRVPTEARHGSMSIH